MDLETSRSLAQSDFDRRLVRWIMHRAGNPRIVNQNVETTVLFSDFAKDPVYVRDA